MMAFLIFIAVGITIACVAVGFTLSHELDRADRIRRWSEEHPGQTGDGTKPDDAKKA